MYKEGNNPSSDILKSLQTFNITKPESEIELIYGHSGKPEYEMATLIRPSN